MEVERRGEVALDQNLDFAHFTSAESALKIIRSNELWLRSPLRMNDYSEILAGFKAIDLGLSKTGRSASRFWTEAQKIFPKFEETFQAIYRSAYQRIPKSTFICSFSEFPQNDVTGRLSMWRAYGYPNGVALIINGDEMLSERQHMDVLSYPVKYLDYGKSVLNLDRELESLTKQWPRLSKFSVDEVASVIVEMLCHLAISTKHFAFEEEAEWRVVYRKEILEKGFLKNRISEIKPQIIGGSPEVVCCLPLDEQKQVSLKRVLKRVLIGPTEYPNESKDAFIEYLREMGYKSPESMVVCSHIPYRG
jgi:hypothetical protein